MCFRSIKYSARAITDGLPRIPPAGEDVAKGSKRSPFRPPPKRSFAERARSQPHFGDEGNEGKSWLKLRLASSDAFHIPSAASCTSDFFPCSSLQLLPVAR